MKALRIVLTQSKAHYRKEESVTNKMTYPLPPLSTVIGALHKACNFKEYQPMDLSIQGSFASLVKQPYTDYCFLDSLNDDRGILVKLKNLNLYSTAFEKVATSRKDTDNSFRRNITIKIHNQYLINEYRELKDVEEKIDIFNVRLNNGKALSEKYKEILIIRNSLTNSSEDKKERELLKKKLEVLKKDTSNGIRTLFKKRKETIVEKKKQLDKKSDEYKSWDNREKEIKAKDKMIKERFDLFKKENYTDKISAFMNLTTSLIFYEVLHDVKLIIHVRSDDETLNTIKENIYNLKAIGRSEDFVDVTECEIVELRNICEDETITSNTPAYINFSLVRENEIYFGKKKDGIPANGTKYYLNKVYNREKGFRDFGSKSKVLFASNYSVDDDTKNIFVDTRILRNGTEELILVNFN